MALKFDRETDGRWIAEVEGVPGALAYGKTKDEAGRNALRVANGEMERQRGELIKRAITEQES